MMMMSLLSFYRWGEVDFLLRKRIESEEDIGYTTTAAEAGMLFIDQVRRGNPVTLTCAVKAEGGKSDRK